MRSRTGYQPKDMSGCTATPKLAPAVDLWTMRLRRTVADVWRFALKAGFTELTVTSVHGAAVAELPWHHRDPFDRLLVAQALSVPARFLTADAVLMRYSELVQQVDILSP
jgi:PIN domain nuclease of toxin-antitoxin system